MSERDEVYLRHILDAIHDIEIYTKNIGETKFKNTKIIQDAVIRNLEVVGEATKNLSASFRKKHRGIEWKKIAGMRDVLIHDYLGVDVEVVWAVVLNRLPGLKKDVRKILNG